MIYEFKSRATGTVIMTKPVAEWILQIIGKTPGRTGIITVDQMPGAVDALNRAIEQEKEELRAERRAMEAVGQRPTDAAAATDDDKADTDADPYPVSLAQRAFPFIDLLKEAHRAGKDITWGV
jgi:cyclopropane-fatty-acyl-phospholipid synthase